MQIIGIWYTPDMMQDFSMVQKEIKKAKDANFDILIAFFRWMHINVMHEEAINAVERSVVYAHELGMKYLVDTDPTWWQTEKVLDAYSHIPLDGVGWDEPARIGGIEEGYYRAGNSFFKFFRKFKGYDLEPNLIYLDDIHNEEHSVKVRNDYYDALTEMNIQAQGEHFEYARKLFGQDILLGTHQTWTPLGDIATGYGDYFRTGKVLNPAWVDTYARQEEDTKWFDEMLHVYCLGDSLRKEYNFRSFYSNDYFEPIQPDQIGFFTRIKMLFDVSWFNLWVGEHTEQMTNLDDRHTPEIGEAAKRLNDFQKFIGNDYRTLTDTAVLYSPVGLYAFASVNYGMPSKLLLMMRYHLVRYFLRAGRTFDFVGTQSIERAKVSNGSFSIDDRTYYRLVLPWMACIPKTVNDKVNEMIKKAVQIIYVGPPSVRFAETGEDISKAFFRMFEIEPFMLNDFMHFVNEDYPAPPEHYPFSHRAYPLSGQQAKFIGNSHDGDSVVVQSQKYPHVIYDSSVDILNPVTYNMMPDKKDTGIRIHINNGYYRIYENTRKKDCYLMVLVSNMRSQLDACITVGKNSMFFCGGTYIVFKVENDKIMTDNIFHE